jgi:hypothetical protein
MVMRPQRCSILCRLAGCVLFLFTSGMALHCGESQGTLDPSFDSGTGEMFSALGFPAPGGQVYVTGHFTRLRVHDVAGLARLHADGSVDRGFDPGDGAGNVFG